MRIGNGGLRLKICARNIYIICVSARSYVILQFRFANLSSDPLMLSDTKTETFR